MVLVNRFLKYVNFDTRSDEPTGLIPSTPEQTVFAEYLKTELESLGLEDITLDEHGYFFATLSANTGKKVPTIGFIAYMNANPDMIREDVTPRIIKGYDETDTVLCTEENIILSPAQLPELLDHKEEDLIVTDDKTLFDADGKTGIARVVSAIVYLEEHSKVKHGRIRIGFNPDEEVDEGAHKFDVGKFGCEWAYTIDGGEAGGLELGDLNATVARIAFRGRSVHPGYVENRMINSIHVISQFIAMLSLTETPEQTEEYEGSYHLINIQGDVEQGTVFHIIRDHDRTRFEKHKREIRHLVAQVNTEYREGTATLELRDQYYNMHEKIEPVIHIIDTVFAAMEVVGVKPNVKSIRGGTDGAQFSFKGLLYPNIFAGGPDFHERYESAPVRNTKKAMNVIVRIAEPVAFE